MNWRKTACSAYPILIIACVIGFLVKDADAGQVRKLDISPDQPGVVHLAFGRTTAISFSVRPEKVVPGSPQAIEVNFLGKDITVRPLSSKAGNLLVYTKTSRFVLLFQVGSEAQYDDVVKVSAAFSKRPLRIQDDSFRIVSLEITAQSKDKNLNSSEVPASMASDEHSIEGIELGVALQPFAHLACSSCVIKHDREMFRLTCSKPIREIHCRASGIDLPPIFVQGECEKRRVG